jgi:flagellar hook assembly protein FlgD
MNLPDLFALTTQTKPSSILDKAIPQGQKALEFTLGMAEEDQSTITDTATDQSSDTFNTGTTNANVGDLTSEPAAPENSLISDTNSAPQTGEEFSTFITLLTAQIRNQDPLAPLDSTQFVDQLATFSNLELQAKGNQTLEEISRLLAASVYGSRE